MTIRGFCPGVHDPMLSGDGWLVRIKPPAGRLPADVIDRLCGGNGIVQVTRRGNLQFRGFSRDGAAAFAASAVGCGVADADPRRERGRRVIAAPLGSTVLPLAIEAQASDYLLHDKFSVLVDDAATLRLDDVGADIAFRVDGDTVRVHIDGAAHEAQCRLVEIGRTLDRIVTAFTDLADGEARMRMLLDDIGEAMFFAAAGLTAMPARRRPMPAATIGDLGGGVVALALPYGQVQSAGLAALAGYCAEQADGFLRPTPWRTLVLAGVKDPAGLARLAIGWDLIVDPADPRLSIVACPGRPACAAGLMETRLVADRIVADRIRPTLLHVSGCAKGCAHPGPAAFTLVGTAEGLSIVRDGRAGDPAEMCHLTTGTVGARLRACCA